MPFPIRTCVVCSEEFELKPDKPGFANRCPECSEPEEDPALPNDLHSADEELNATRRRVMKEMLYRREE